MSKEIIPVFGQHTSGEQYHYDLQTALSARGSDLVPLVYGWSAITAAHVHKAKPTVLAIDGVDGYTHPRTLHYAFPSDPFTLKGSRPRMLLVGADIGYETPRKGIRSLADASIEKYWVRESAANPEQEIRGQYGGLKDHAGMVALAVLTAGAAAYDTVLGATFLGVSLSYAARLPIYQKLMKIEEERQLVKRSILFRGLLRATTPLSAQLTTITFRNALTALKLNDVGDESSVALFGNAHALGGYVWDSEKAQKKVVAREVKKLREIATDINGVGLSKKQNTQLAEDLTIYLGTIGIWKVLDRPDIMNYRNLERAIPYMGSVMSHSVGNVVEDVFRVLPN